MTAAAVRSAAPEVRVRVRTRDLLWVLRRRHRAALWVSLAGTVLFAAGLVWANHRLGGAAACRAREDAAQSYDSCASAYASRAAFGRNLLVALTVAPVLLGVFCGAPLFSREFERGTHVLTTTSDVSQRRWLRVQVLALLTWGAVLAGLLALIASPLRHTLLAQGSDLGIYSGWNWVLWSSGWLLVPYAVSACAIGLLLSSLVRRTVPALAITAIVVTALRVGAIDLVRPHWWPPQRVYSALGSYPSFDGRALTVTQNAFADARGHTRAFPRHCLQGPDVEFTDRQYRRCLAPSGITQRLATFQPASRIEPFEIAEGGAFLLLSGIALAGTARLLRRDPPA